MWVAKQNYKSMENALINAKSDNLRKTKGILKPKCKPEWGLVLHLYSLAKGNHSHPISVTPMQQTPEILMKRK